MPTLAATNNYGGVANCMFKKLITNCATIILLSKLEIGTLFIWCNMHRHHCSFAKLIFSFLFFLKNFWNKKLYVVGHNNSGIRADLERNIFSFVPVHANVENEEGPSPLQPRSWQTPWKREKMKIWTDFIVSKINFSC